MAAYTVNGDPTGGALTLTRVSPTSAPAASSGSSVHHRHVTAGHSPLHGDSGGVTGDDDDDPSSSSTTTAPRTRNPNPAALETQDDGAEGESRRRTSSLGSPPGEVVSPNRGQSQNQPSPSPSSSSSSAGRPKPSAEEKEEALRRFSLPVELPSLGEIRRALPPHVFRSSAATSLGYVVRDLLQVAALFLLGELLWSSPALPSGLRWALLPAYWLLQGTLFWAVFVLGHDCGHASFSASPLLNDVVGNVLHAFLLCPYYCWKLSHRHHHAFTGNIDKDEVFYPVREAQKHESGYFLPVFGFGASWFIYLFAGYSPRNVNHFNPGEAMFSRHVGHCCVSVTLVGLWALALLHLVYTFGIVKVAVLYGVPEFVFGTYLVMTTFLHHTDHDLPWYGEGVWSFVRGQLSSIDRHYGWCHTLVHNIGTHQVHHLFSTIPHYHLEEATEVFRRKYPELVRQSDERLLPAFCRIFYLWLRQRLVPDDALIHVYNLDT